MTRRVPCLSTGHAVLLGVGAREPDCRVQEGVGEKGPQISHRPDYLLTLLTSAIAPNRAALRTRCARPAAHISFLEGRQGGEAAGHRRAGAADPLALHRRDLLPRSRQMQGQPLAALAAAEDDDIKFHSVT